MTTKPAALTVVETTGKLDRILSEMILLSKSFLDEPDWQTLKHHAEDMAAASSAVMKRYAVRNECEPFIPDWIKP